MGVTGTGGDFTPFVPWVEEGFTGDFIASFTPGRLFSTSAFVALVTPFSLGLVFFRDTKLSLSESTTKREKENNPNKLFLKNKMSFTELLCMNSQELFLHETRCDETGVEELTQPQ